MEKNTDRMLWTIFVLMIGMSILVVAKPMFSNIFSDAVQQILYSTKDVDSSSKSDFSYRLNTTDHTASIEGYSGHKENLKIPQYRKMGSTYYKVTSIGDTAFYNTKLTSVNIPDSVTSVGDWAFAGTKLTSVNFPAGVTSIGDHTFYMTNLTSINLPDNLTSIGEAAFASTKLTSVDFPTGLTSIGYGAFYHTPISAISFKHRVDLDDRAFGVTNLTNVTLPTGSTYKANTSSYPTFDSNVKVTVK